MADTENNPSNRQIVYLFLGFVILFIFTFSLGVIVGKGLGGSKTQITSEEAPPKTSGKDVQESEETTQIITGKELPSESPTAPIQEEMIEVEEEVNIQIPPSGPFEKQIETKTDKPSSGELLSEKPLPTVEPMEKKSQLETNKVEPIKKDIAALPAIQPGGRYTIQIGAFQKEEEAKQIVNNLKSKGYPAFIKTAEVPGKGTWYRVRIGTFTTRVTAKLYANNLKNLEPSIKFVFITVNN